MAFADEFFSIVATAREPVLYAAAQIKDFVEFTPAWLVFLYQIIKGTTPALEFARSRTKGFPALQNYYTTKLDDESGHDRAMRDDIEKHVTPNIDAFPVMPYAAEMVGRQFYLIEMRHPALYLGFIGLLEGFPFTEGQVDEIQAASNLPSAAFRTLRMHARVDVKHREDLVLMLNEVPSDLHSEIVDNAARCAQLQALALASLVLRSNKNE